MLKSKLKILRVLLLLIVLGALTSCGPQGAPESCIAEVNVDTAVDIKEVIKKFTVRADGNYSTIVAPIFDEDGNQISGFDTVNENKSGKWLSTGLRFQKGTGSSSTDNIGISATGEVGMAAHSTGMSKIDEEETGRPIKVSAKNVSFTPLLDDRGKNADGSIRNLCGFKGDLVTISIGDANSKLATSLDGEKGNKWIYMADGTKAPPSWIDGLSAQNTDPTDNNYALLATETTNNFPPGEFYRINGYGLELRVGDMSGTAASAESSNVKYKNGYGKPAGFGGFEVKLPQDGCLWMKVDTGNLQKANVFGGYTIYIRHQKGSVTDSHISEHYSNPNIGRIEYALVNGGNPNETTAQNASRVQDFTTGVCMGYNPGVLNWKKTLNSASVDSQKVDGCGTLWLRVTDAEDYNDNVGSYNVAVKYFQKTTSFASILDSIIQIVQATVFPAVGQILNGTLLDPDFQDLVRITLIIYIAGSCIFFIMGMLQITQMELVIRLTKIAFVMMFLSTAAFDFVNTYLFGFFVNGSREILNMLIGQDPSSNPFNFIDRTLGIFTIGDVWLKILALVFLSYGIGLVLVIALVYAMVKLIIVIFKALISYIIAIMYISLLTIMAPIFFLFLLPSEQGPFAPIRQYFNTYISYFVRYSLEPIILIFGIFLINELIREIFLPIIAYKTCWKCIVNVTLPFEIFDNRLSLFCIFGYMPFGYDDSGAGWGTNIIMQLFISVLIFLILVDLMKKWLETSAEVILYLTGTFGLGGGGNLTPGQIMGEAGEFFKSVVGQGQSAVQRRTAAAEGKEDPNKSAFDPSYFPSVKPNTPGAGSPEGGGATPPPVPTVPGTGGLGGGATPPATGVTPPAGGATPPAGGAAATTDGPTPPTGGETTPTGGAPATRTVSAMGEDAIKAHVETNPFKISDTVVPASAAGTFTPTTPPVDPSVIGRAGIPDATTLAADLTNPFSAATKAYDEGAKLNPFAPPVEDRAAAEQVKDARTELVRGDASSVEGNANRSDPAELNPFGEDAVTTAPIISEAQEKEVPKTREELQAAFEEIDRTMDEAKKMIDDLAQEAEKDSAAQGNSTATTEQSGREVKPLQQATPADSPLLAGKKAELKSQFDNIEGKADDTPPKKIFSGKAPTDKGELSGEETEE